MARDKNSRSPRSEDVSTHYASGYEAQRLHSASGQLDRDRSRELIARFLPSPPATVLDIGGGPGAHACWLAQAGYQVHLVDIVPLHVQLAQQASDAQPDAPLASATVGDACSLAFQDDFADGVLLFGPLYHLTDRKDRLTALREAHRVLKPGGVALGVGISRFASTLDGLRNGYLKGAEFIEIVERDLTDGQHINTTGKPEYFMDTFFHHPDELREEFSEAGYQDVSLCGVEGPGWLLQDFEDWWQKDDLRGRLMELARRLESEPALLGISAHLVAVGRKG